MHRLQLISASVSIGMLAAFATSPARAQVAFPDRPIRLVVGFSAGGSNDLIGRMVAAKLSDRLGKQVVVDNRPGAGGVVASELVAHSPADGHTLMVVSIAHTANPGLYKLKYDTEKAFVPVAQLGTGVAVFAIHPSVPANTLREFLTYAKANPEKVQFAHAGIGTFQHMAISQLQILAGLDLVQIPFKGGGPATIDVVAGHTQAAIFTLVQVSGHMRSGKLRALGVGSSVRSASAPEVPTIAEAGLPGYEADNWWGVVGPAGIPQPIIDKLAHEIAAVQDLEDLKTALAKEGAEPVKRGSAEFGQFISRELVKWARVIKEGKIKIE